MNFRTEFSWLVLTSRTLFFSNLRHKDMSLMIRSKLLTLPINGQISSMTSKKRIFTLGTYFTLISHSERSYNAAQINERKFPSCCCLTTFPIFRCCRGCCFRCCCCCSCCCCCWYYCYCCQSLSVIWRNWWQASRLQSPLLLNTNL